MESLKEGESTCIPNLQDQSNSPTLPPRDGFSNKRLSILEKQKLQELKQEISVMKNRLNYIENVKQKTDKQILLTKKFMKKQKTAQDKKKAVQRMLSVTYNALEDDQEQKKSQAKAIKSEIQRNKGKSIQEIHKHKKLKVRKVRDESRRSEMQIRMQREQELMKKKQQVQKIRNQKKSDSKSIQNSKFLEKSHSKHKFKTAKVSCLPLTPQEDYYNVYRRKEEMQKELEQLRNEECNKLIQLQSKLNQKQKVYAESKLSNS